ncbi:MAG: DNA gyrase subunit A [Phycisphaerales bacterium]
MPDQSHDTSPNNNADQPYNIGHVIEREINAELHDSYLTYAMSTIMDRALPDVRDGLKPSQRRILVAMNDLNLAPNRKHIKCAKICGDTSGNYHPHGESVVYPTLVNMGQDWKMRAMLVDKQGNFGSIDGDPPAAMRYTEARMTAATVEMMADIKLDTVNYQPNYDDRLTEPVVLPARFPNLLVNGSSGIAVGMASSMPPHNVGEVCNAIMAVLENPDLTIAEILTHMPGPDFPTGGIIHGRGGIIEAYTTGRGKMYVRGKLHIETLANGREQLVIDEVPYQVVQGNLMEKATEAVKAARIPDIANIRNESGRKHRTRIVVELKRGADAGVVEKQLYQFTPLQSTISIINIAIVRNQPRTLSIKQLIEEYIRHRTEVIRRRTAYLLQQARKRAHILEGLMFAVCDIDEVIALIRGSHTREEAIDKLMKRSFRIAADHEHVRLIPQRLMDIASREQGVLLTRVQADAIGSLRLIQLVGLEIEKLANEYGEVASEIEDLENILATPERVRAFIREDLIGIRERFNDPRRTAIEDAEVDDYNVGDLIQEHEVVVTISHDGYAKRIPIDTYREQGRGGRGVKASDAKEGDFIEHLFVASSHDDLLCFTSNGRVFKMKVYQIPEGSRTSRGRAIVNLLELREDEKARAFLTIQDFEKSEDFLFFATASGKTKRTALADYRNVNRSGIIAIKLNEGDSLVDVVHTTGRDHILLATRNGYAIRFDENDVRVMGRTAAGVRGMKLRDEMDKVVGLVRCRDDADLLTVTEHGYGKRTALTEYLVQSEDGSARPQNRGGKGRIDIRTTERNGDVVAIRCVEDSDSIMCISEGGMMVRIPAASISHVGRATKGVRVVNLKNDDSLVAIARVVESDEADEEITGQTTA